MATTTMPQQRELFRACLAYLVEQTQEKYPQVNGRAADAATLILQGDVTLLDDGTARVGSGSNPALVYSVGGLCECQDFAHRAPLRMCKHKIAHSYARTLFNKGLWVDADGVILQEEHTMAYDANFPEAETPTRAQAMPEPQPTRQTQRTAPVMPQVDVPIIATVTLRLRGQLVEVKVCDVDDGNLMKRVDWLIATYPLQAAGDFPPQGQPQAGAVQQPSPPQTSPSQDGGEHLCTWHGKMKASTKAPGSYYCTGKMGDGSYCKEVWPPKN